MLAKKIKKNVIMKNILRYALFLGINILAFGCTTDSYEEPFTTELSEVSIRAEDEEFGKQMAASLRHVATQMNKNGDGFGDLEKIKAAIAKYMPQDAQAQSLSTEELDGMLQEKYQPTPVQAAFLEKIQEAQAESRTASELMQHLKAIMEEIQATVPAIQQRNLLKTAAALYYLTREIDLLLKEGLMPVDLQQPQHIRLRSGNNEVNSYWSALLAGACVNTGSMGAEILATLRAMASAASVYLTLLGGCLLLTGDTRGSLSDAACLALSKKCVDQRWKPNGERMECSICYGYCIANHRWNYSACPLQN